jgi:hypothetical protein
MIGIVAREGTGDTRRENPAGIEETTIHRKAITIQVGAILGAAFHEGRRMTVCPLTNSAFITTTTSKMIIVGRLIVVEEDPSGDAAAAAAAEDDPRHHDIAGHTVMVRGGIIEGMIEEEADDAVRHPVQTTAWQLQISPHRPGLSATTTRLLIDITVTTARHPLLPRAAMEKILH